MYDQDYYYMLLKANSSTAERINSIRWEFVAKAHPKVVLDYGAGVGWFKAFAPPGVTVDTFDIGPYPTTGIRHDAYDLVTMWDVIEHIPNFNDLKGVLSKARNVALSVPILPEGKELRKWKHCKPDEHLHYFTVRILDEIFRCYGFEKIAQGTPECVLREDIISLLYAKNNP